MKTHALAKSDQGELPPADAIQILVASGNGYRRVIKQEKQRLVVAFAKRDKPVYGEAFDLVRLSSDVDLADQADIERNLGCIQLVEVKSTAGKRQSGKVLNAEFDGYFFAITTAELLVAQKLGTQYSFVFVNRHTGIYKELTLREIFWKAKAIYPQWSISF